MHTQFYEFTMKMHNLEQNVRLKKKRRRDAHHSEIALKLRDSSYNPWRLMFAGFFVKASLQDTLHSNKIFKVYQPISNRKVNVVVVKKGNSYRCGAGAAHFQNNNLRYLSNNQFILYRFYYWCFIYLFFS